MRPPVDEPSRKSVPVRRPEAGLLTHCVVTCALVSGRGMIAVGAGRSPCAKRSRSVLFLILAAASSRKGGTRVCLSRCQASHSYRRCQIVHCGYLHNLQRAVDALPWVCCLCCGHSPPAMRNTSALRCVCVHGEVPALCLLRGPLRSPCIASQKIMMPGSP